MVSSDTPATATAPTTTSMDLQGDSSPRAVTIHVLSPSLPPPSRVTLRDVPLETTVAQLRTRISLSLPHQPEPATQRLIYLGRVLVNDSSTLSETFGPVEQSEHSIHLVLPPSASPASQHASGSAALPSSNAVGSLLASHMAAINHAMHQAAGNGHPQVQHVATHAQPFSAAQVRLGPSSALNGVASGHASDEFSILERELEKAENEVDHNLIPSHENLYHLRRRIEQQQHQLGLPQMHPDSVSASHDFGALLQRVEALYRRIDGLPSNQSGRLGQPLHNLHSNQQVYLTTAADGRQCLIIPPSASSSSSSSFSSPAPLLRPNLPLNVISSTFANSIRPPSETLHHDHADAHDRFAGNPAPNRADNGHARGPNPAIILQNALNQRAANLQPHRRPQNILAASFVTRIWLFVRLYFFIYMTTNSGSWARIFMVTGAVLVALFSESTIPERLHNALVVPVQQHLERLTHMGGPADLARPAAGAGAGPAAGGNARNDGPGELWASIRRIERAVVLLLASLIPGIGERQVEARNAAEAEAERQRQEEQQQQQQRLLEQEREQQDQQQGQQPQEENAAQAETQDAPQSIGAAHEVASADTTNTAGPSEHLQSEEPTTAA
ncbi:hypothetical protein POX_c03937 [Penicillium oxalicum]|uniref:hypothetical protein n=1 Tax=Penicillium oxalicum TaxID=69781 RepID=UPI0020B7210E|nr:hypothetical protein POX_c03937 [Penicillium oxalicum]KAI2791082.1 hypothetical protein POX_c03937 [Penicillium oxalicum]